MIDGSECIFTSEIDMVMLRVYRSHEAMENAYRKTFLLDDEVNEPFIRKGIP